MPFTNRAESPLAAHPVAESLPGWVGTVGKLDGSEVVQPVIYSSESARLQLWQFYVLAPVAAIGSSDYHGTGPLGLGRTYVFARESSEPAILEALQAGRTVVFDGARAYGDPALVQLAEENRPLLEARVHSPGVGPLHRVSRIFGVAGKVEIILFSFREPRKSPQAQ